MRPLVMLIAPLVLVVAACAPSAAPAGGRVDESAEIRIAASEDQWPAQGEGFKSTTFSYPLNVNVFEPLVSLGSDYSLKPGIAERWELIEPNTWRFHIRRNVQFHNGHVLTGDDVLWTWGERQLKGQTLSTVTSTLGPDSVKLVDEYTIDITPKVPNLRLPEQILHPEGAILQRGQQQDTQPPNGTGPFRVVEYQKQSTVVLERFDGYWGTKPKVKRVIVRFLPDAQTRIQALKAGEVDFVVDVPADATRSLESQGFRVVRSNPGRNQLIYLYRNGAPRHDLLGDRNIRQAISLAVDRRQYVETVFDGNAAPGRAMAPPAILGSFAEQVPDPAFDPAKARAILDQAGWKAGADGIRAKDGRPLRLELIAWAEVTSTALEFLQAQLRAIGVDVVVKKAPDTPTYQGFYRGNAFDLDLEVPNQNDGNPAFLPVLRMYSKISGTERFAPGGEFDQWAEKALAAETVDAAREASARMMRILIHEEFVVVPLAGVFRLYAMRKGVDLADPHPSQTNQLWLTLTVTR